MISGTKHRKDQRKRIIDALIDSESRDLELVSKQKNSSKFLKGYKVCLEALVGEMKYKLKKNIEIYFKKIVNDHLITKAIYVFVNAQQKLLKIKEIPGLADFEEAMATEGVELRELMDKYQFQIHQHQK